MSSTRVPAGRVPATVVVGVAAVAVVGAGVGAVVLLSSSAESSPADSVPQDADYVGHVDADAMREKPPDVRAATREALAFQSLVVFYDGPDFPTALAFRNDTGLDPAAVHGVTYFGHTNDSYAARIVRAEWTEPAVVAAVEREANVNLSAARYRNRSLYVAADDSTAVAVLEEGRYVVGGVGAVRDAVDVAVGDADPVAGVVRREFEQRAGYVRFAFRFDPRTVPDIPLVGTGGFEAVRVVAASYDTNATANGTRIGVAIDVTVADAEGADQVQALLDTAVVLYRTQVAGPELAAEFEKVDLAATDRTVRIAYESTPDGLRTMLEGLERRPR